MSEPDETLKPKEDQEIGLREAGFFDQAIRNLRSVWRRIADQTYDVETAKLRPNLPDDDRAILIRQMHACLDGKGGAVSARARSAALGQAYLALDTVGRKRFLGVLVDEFGTDHDAVRKAAETVVRSDLDGIKLEKAEDALRKALDSPRKQLLMQFTDLPDGVKFLVDMRADLLDFAGQDRTFRPLERELKGLLATWFDVGFLKLERITWETAPAALLEKFIAYEAVHAIESWGDLKNRLGWDRRLFAYFHPRMPDEPLIFVEVALVVGIAGNVQVLLDEDAPLQEPAESDTAIFYSISNAQKGLAGISFGDFLIKRVVGLLTEEFPNLETFSTLSPIPGFRKWLNETIKKGDKRLVLPAERTKLKALSQSKAGAKAVLKSLLDTEDWMDNEEVCEVLRPLLTRLCGIYLVAEKRRSKIKGQPDTARDPVAHFHLSNGARVERLNWMADRSSKGMSQSFGLMVNYLYELGAIDDNHESYRADGSIAVSSAIKALTKS